MPTTRRPAAARRLVVVIAVAVLAMLVSPLAGLETSGADSTRGTAQGTQAASGAGVQAVVAGAARKAKKAKAKKGKKARKKASRKGRRAAAASRAPRAVRAAAAPASVAWSSGTLRYHDALPAQWAWSLRTAVEAWNSSGAAITLVPVSNPAQAQVRIGYGSIGGSSGLATVGRTSGAFVKLSDRYRTFDATDPYYQVEVAGVLTHELGHVLGLDHVATSCQLMGTVMDIVGCGIFDMGHPEAYRCDLVGAAAAQGAVRLYGGSATARRTGTCAVPAA